MEELLEKELTQLCNSFPSNLLEFLIMKDAILLRALETSEQELNLYTT